MIRNREERKSLNEHCLWCSENKRVVHKGIIVNESASGLLLQTEIEINLGDTLYLLTPCFGEPLTPDNLSVKQLIQYPVTRKGTVVRSATKSEYGIHFEAEDKPAEFRRWYRESSSIYTFLTKQVAVIVIEGDINLETSTLLQSLVNKFKREVSEFVFSLEKVHTFAGVAGTVVKSIIKSCGSDQKTAMVIYGSNYEKSRLLVKDLLSDSIFGFLTSDVYQTKPISLPKVGASTSQTTSRQRRESNKTVFSNEIRFLVLSPKVLNQKKYLQIIQETKGKGIAVPYMHDALNKILEYEYHFVVADVEIEDVSLLLLMNQLITKNLSHFPELIILGPKHVDELVKAALKLPVHTYLTKPFLEKEFQYTIEHIMHEKSKQ